MATYLRKIVDEKVISQIAISENDWNLDSQLKILEAWLVDNCDVDLDHGDWVADIGFEPRPDVVVAGYTVSTKLMSLFLAFLSLLSEISPCTIYSE